MYLKIRNIGLLMLFAVLMVFCVWAKPAESICDNEGFKCECQNFYNDMNYVGVEKWFYDNGEGDYVVDETNPTYSYFNIDVSGDLHEFEWKSSPSVYSVLVKAGNEHVEWSGGSSGKAESKKEVSHITFCIKKQNGGNGCTGDNCGGGAVPEFPAYSLFGAVLAVSLGLVFMRKH